jgi:hypothetical protein
MVLALRQHAGDDPALFGDPQPAFGAEGFKVDRLVQIHPIKKNAPPLWKRRGGFSTWAC